MKCDFVLVSIILNVILIIEFIRMEALITPMFNLFISIMLLLILFFGV